MTSTSISKQYDLPEDYVQQLLPLLKDEADAFFASYDAPPCRGIRFRDHRVVLPLRELEGPIPYAKNAFYLSADSKAGALPLHDAGAYYIQEPSAMAAAAVLAPQDGDRVLDLCAAPGGKSTQLAASAALSLLVCNEPIPSRAQVLSGNIERMGIANAIVTCAYPDRLAEQWAGFFDKILVDAPCSGEGMFRKHPEARAEWTSDSPQRCHERQVDILNSAAKMLRVGGRMVFSTCTFNDIENENSVFAFLKTHSNFKLLPIHISGLPDADTGMLRLWPHRFRGEGHFVALLEKTDAAPEEASPVLSSDSAPPTKAEQAAFLLFNHELGFPVQPNLCQGNRLFSVPEALPPLKGIRVLRMGLHLGEIRGKVFLPDHALALALPAQKRFEIDNSAVVDYLHGDTLPCDETLRGYYAISYKGFQLGFGKASAGQMKNHYPKGLRH